MTKSHEPLIIITKRDTVPLKTAALWEVSPHKSEIKIYDEDNSVFFLVPKTRHITIDYRVPEGYSESNE